MVVIAVCCLASPEQQQQHKKKPANGLLGLLRRQIAQNKREAKARLPKARVRIRTQNGKKKAKPKKQTRRLKKSTTAMKPTTHAPGVGGVGALAGGAVAGTLLGGAVAASKGATTQKPNLATIESETTLAPDVAPEETSGNSTPQDVAGSEESPTEPVTTSSDVVA